MVCDRMVSLVDREEMSYNDYGWQWDEEPISTSLESLERRLDMSDVTRSAAERSSCNALPVPDSTTFLSLTMLSASAATKTHARLRSAQL